MDLCEFETNLVYRVSSRTARATQRNCRFKKRKIGAGEMAKQVRAMTALLKILSSNPSNHMVAHSHP